MDQIASFTILMLAAMAIGLSVLVAGVFCIGMCQFASWMWTRFHLAPVAHAMVPAYRRSPPDSR